MTATLLLALTPFIAGMAGASAPEDCDGDEFYFASDKPRDVAKAFACYRASDNFLMLAIMHLNGEGTPVDVAAARASFARETSSSGGDFDALDAIIKKREANPTAQFPRVDYCRDVAVTTKSWDTCRAREESKKTSKADAQLEKVGRTLNGGARVAFDRARAAYSKFVDAEGMREYYESIEGTARDAEAMAQEARVRRNFVAAIQRLVTGPSGKLAGRRSFADADKELNVVYNEKLSRYMRDNEESAVDAEQRKDPELAAEHRQYNSDYKAKSRAAQHEWVRYRDAMGDLAAARWPDRPNVREQARALVTEDRIRELRGK
jgi:hypothetical protein